MKNYSDMAIDLQLASRFNAEVPDLQDINKWVSISFAAIGRTPADLTIRVVDAAEITDLNHRYRGKNQPTNVLAFPFEAVAEVDYHPLGDIVICFSVVKNESGQQDISVFSHFAHMVVHAALHLCGYDHQTDEDAVVMADLEKRILAAIGVDYEDKSGQAVSEPVISSVLDEINHETKSKH